MHGGSAAIQEIDLEEKSVSIQLGGACSGCGISPMTIQALKSRLPNDIPEIDTVEAWTGNTGSEGMVGGSEINTPTPQQDFNSDDDDDSGIQAPF